MKNFCMALIVLLGSTTAFAQKNNRKVAAADLWTLTDGRLISYDCSASLVKAVNPEYGCVFVFSGMRDIRGSISTYDGLLAVGLQQDVQKLTGKKLSVQLEEKTNVVYGIRVEK